MNLETVYEEMKWNIITRFVFYIPNNEYSKMMFDDTTLCEMDQKIFYVNSDKKVKEFPEINPADFYDKEKLLQDNFFKLLELKNKMDNDSFILFHKTYLDKLEGFIYVAETVIKYIKRDIPDCNKDAMTFINYNFTLLSVHANSVRDIVPIKNDVAPKIKKFDFSILEDLPIKNDFKPEQAKKMTIPFIDFIRHENKIEIERIIKVHYSDLRGVKLRYLIEFLKEEGVLFLNHGDATKLYKSVKILFGDKNIGAYTSIFDNKVFSSSDVKYEKTKMSFTKIFKDIM